MPEPTFRYRKKPVEIEATRWFKNGDHPLDNGDAREGRLVRYYRSPVLSGLHVCIHCSQVMNKHGWIDTLEGGHVVCPGDYIITGIAGERYPCKPAIFDASYSIVPEDTTHA